MKHATPETLAAVSPLLEQLRGFALLVERTPGSFYLKSKAFLHFHDDPSGVFADVKLDLASFARMCVTSKEEQSALLAQVRRCVASVGKAKGTAGGSLNKAWHEAHRMPHRPSAEQRIEWHLAHASHCGCRPVPAGVLALMRTRGIEAPGSHR